jgi:hypothetical protein
MLVGLSVLAATVEQVLLHQLSKVVDSSEEQAGPGRRHPL